MTEPASSERSYSTAFDRLVVGEDGGTDIVGLLAYALYKRDKRELALSGALDEEHLRNHYKTLTSGLLNQYRESALRQLESYSASVVAQATPEIQDGARISAVEQARDAVIAEVRGSTAWWLSILWNVVAWLLSLAIVFLVTVGTGKVSFQVNG